jgi:tRNA G37 N-methylase Trm5
MTSKKNLKTILKNKIPDDKINYLSRSFEIVGDIAICEIDDKLIEYEKEIGKAIVELNKSIKVVLKKDGNHYGEFRLQKLKYVYGENRKETIYQENGIKLLLNPEEVYFSARLSTEREQLMNNLEKNKRILIMFSGSGPYSFVALKKQPNISEITSIEINPKGHFYALESLKLNKNIIKKSDLYQEILKFLKENSLPIYEKKLIENLNRLRLHFINADVKKISRTDKLFVKKIKEEQNHFHNKLFNESPQNLFEFLKEINTNTLYFDLNEKDINKNHIIYFTILFLDKFEIIAKIKENYYKFENDFEKNQFINILEGKEINGLNYDEIFMPLPKDAEFFLEDAFKFINNKSTIHMYGFLHENEFPKKAENAIIEAAKKANLKVKIIETRKVGQYSPRKFRTCTDFIVFKNLK